MQLVTEGRVFEVLRWAEEWRGGGADPSLVRHLAFGVMEVAAPPYSPEFAGAMLRCGLGGLRWFGVAAGCGMHARSTLQLRGAFAAWRSRARSTCSSRV